MTDSVLDRLVEAAFWTLGILCLLSATDVSAMWSRTTLAMSVVTVLACLPALAGLVRIGPREVLGTPGVLLLSCLLSYAAVGVVVGVLSGTEVSAMLYVRRVLFSILVVVGAAVGGRVALRRLGPTRLLMGITLILAASCALILASPWLWNILPYPPPAGTYRLSGTFRDPNDAAIVASFAVVTALALLRYGRFLIPGYGTLLVGVAAAVATLSRTAVIVLPVVMLSALFAARGPQRRRLGGALGIVAVAVASVAMTVDVESFQEAQIERFRTLADLAPPVVVDDESLANRLPLWELGLDQALESPLAGSGLGSFHNLEGAWINPDGDLMGVHNQYLLLLGEAGFLPLILFVWFLAVTLRAGFRNQRTGALGAVSGWVFVFSLFSLTFHHLLLHWTVNFIIGLSCAVMTGSLPDEGERAGSIPAPRTDHADSGNGLPVPQRQLVRRESPRRPVPGRVLHR